MPDYENFEDRPARKRTLESIEKELAPLGFSSDLIYGLWHKLNGRDEEASSYMESYFEEQELMQKQTVPAIEPVSVDTETVDLKIEVVEKSEPC